MDDGTAIGTFDANMQNVWVVPAQCKLTEPCLCGGLDNHSVACHKCWGDLADSEIDGICKWCTVSFEVVTLYFEILATHKEFHCGIRMPVKVDMIAY